jgi:serine/threonine protein kinase
MSQPSSSSARLDRIVEEFIGRHDRGERPSVTEYAERYPDLAGEIRELFPALLLMQQARPQPDNATGPFEPVAPSTEGRRPERLGDYRVLREVGRGGMGIVSEAEQESLGRHVALKVLPAHALLDPQRLRRFQLEARSAARLHHSNIVPVFAVGAHAGLHYYVMQFIQGLGLDEVLVELKRLRQARAGEAGRAPGPTDRPSAVTAAEVAHGLLTGEFHLSAREQASEEPGKGPDGPRQVQADSSVHLPGQAPHSSLSESGQQYWQSVARIGVQVAEALAYAHGQGTLHRDVKPSNLLLDTQGTVWVTDFGLAKSLGSEELTHTGDVVGTLRYLAPERFQGRSDARGDVR